jgi:hypothetical protein
MVMMVVPKRCQQVDPLQHSAKSYERRYSVIFILVGTGQVAATDGTNLREDGVVFGSQRANIRASLRRRSTERMRRQQYAHIYSSSLSPSVFVQRESFAHEGPLQRLELQRSPVSVGVDPDLRFDLAFYRLSSRPD